MKQMSWNIVFLFYLNTLLKDRIMIRRDSHDVTENMTLLVVMSPETIPPQWFWCCNVTVMLQTRSGDTNERVGVKQILRLQNFSGPQTLNLLLQEAALWFLKPGLLKPNRLPQNWAWARCGAEETLRRGQPATRKHRHTVHSSGGVSPTWIHFNNMFVWNVFWK